MKVTSYGLFWRKDEIDWHPGNGNHNRFRLLGRVGSNRGHIKIVDFRHQQGIYILYDHYGPGYVGLTRNQGLGKRLKDHTQDHLAGKWDRFSWFGFRPIDETPTEHGLLPLGETKEDLTEETNTTIGDLEALLIRAIGPKRNRVFMGFGNAEEWTQIEYDRVDTYMNRLGND
ncbi:GIY-YIG nuclease family protein [Komagataeibacter rhaeticus]|uniref:GIY-YIG nuclease family protein n=1 Tax=Komagataeibacter rhaeticus TaxID=215221 RepID=A0A181CAE3_9PROT|nr:GIY-YIG nuclease family protein [Komagataeibacter rhaeticus]ATU72920.1 hypothetical protein CT154_08770 [Komagataeibacter xylinus]QIP35331.1 GIY-YIG nuclease family protein [Komagataeibacter rhaeticus]QOC47896.1 GIY-YIG nuclease family protein [Komagataeibacter rhaeticus]WPP22724.1 GIY-YIG nuclease family protein [Komagataeibacter rhaeticus]SAY48549.1 hypothetical protein KRIGEM_01497 [Komagataeibacter rhaeticus]